MYQSSRSIFSCAAFSIAAGSLPRISSPSALKKLKFSIPKNDFVTVLIYSKPKSVPPIYPPEVVI